MTLTFIAFFSELIGTLSGFGSSTFFVPIAVLIEDFHFVLVITAILHCLGNLSRIFLFKEFFQFPIFFRLAFPSVVLTGLGAVLTTQIHKPLFENSLGAVLILLSVLLMFGKELIQQLPLSAAYVLTGISGFLTGFIGTGGALRGVALTALKVEKNAFVSLSASIDLGGDFLRLIVYLKNQFMDWDQWFYIPLLGLAAFFGSKVAKSILGRIKQEQFDRIVTAFIFLSGLVLILKK